MAQRINNEALIALAEKEEPRFLSILLKDKDCLMEAIGFGIRPDMPKHGKKAAEPGHFWIPECKLLYALIYNHYVKHASRLTRTAVESTMDAMQEYEGQPVTEENRIKARAIWDRIFNLHVDSEDFSMLMYNINERFIQWQAWRIIKERSQELAAATSNQIEIVKDIRQSFIGLENLDADSYTLTMDFLDQGIDEFINFVTDKRERPDELAGLFCGIKALDNIFNGFAPGSYTVVSGMVNGGKTTLMMNMAWNMAKSGYVVVYVSLEKSARMVFTRMLCCESLVDFNRIKRGGKGNAGIDDSTFEKLTKTAEEMRNRAPKFVCIQMPQYTELSSILARVDKIRTVQKIDVLFIDYLGVIKNETNHTGNPYYDDAITARRLISYAKSKQIATITAQQLRKQAAKDIRGKAMKATLENVDTFEINTEDISGVQAVTADADNVIGVILNNDHPATKMFATITKARDDQSKVKIVLDFDGCLGKINDPVDGSDGHIKDVDAILYGTELSEDELMKEDGLFESLSSSIDKTTNTTEDALFASLDKIGSVADSDSQELEKKPEDDYLDDSDLSPSATEQLGW